MHTSSPLYPLEMTSPSTTTTSSSSTVNAATSSASLRRSPSCEWKEWEETLDNLDTVSGLFGIDTGMDVIDLDQFLLVTADEFLGPDSAADQEFFYEKEQDLKMLLDAGFHAQSSDSSLVESKFESQTLLQQKKPMLPMTMGSAIHRHRKRKTAELYRLQNEARDEKSRLKKKVKRQAQDTSVEITSMKNGMNANDQLDKMYRRRYDILHGILEAWNTGGIEDLEEIADNVYHDDVTLISPDYSEGLHGVEAVMSHWSLLLDAFPDGMMEEYIIQREEGSTEKMKATWTFSGTQIFPIFGVEPRHEKVSIRGKSVFLFKGDRIRQIVLSWNYGETLLKLMGVQSDETKNVDS